MEIRALAGQGGCEPLGEVATEIGGNKGLWFCRFLGSSSREVSLEEKFH